MQTAGHEDRDFWLSLGKFESMQTVEIILYVSSQEKSRDFYSAVLEMNPILDVPGMTEFSLNTGCLLGLMPETGIARILGSRMPHPAEGNGIPRCELYLFVENPVAKSRCAVSQGAKLIEESRIRDWGHEVAYVADSDGHVIAFAKKSNA